MYILREKYRLTIKFEVILYFMIWTMTNSFSVYFIFKLNICGLNDDVSKIFELIIKFLIPLRNIMLNIVLIVSLHIRSRLFTIPNPPSNYLTSIFLFENKQMFLSCYDFLLVFENSKYLSVLELGLYNNIYKINKKKKFLDIVRGLCRKNKIPEEFVENYEKIDEFVKKNVDEFFPYFKISSNYLKMQKSFESKVLTVRL